MSEREDVVAAWTLAVVEEVLREAAGQVSETGPTSSLRVAVTFDVALSPTGDGVTIVVPQHGEEPLSLTVSAHDGG
jgi:hypothetical protein